MKITFGIITFDDSSTYMEEVIQSIVQQNIPEYEIIIVGGTQSYGHTHIPFNEESHRGWITKKKNLVTQNAKYDIIVYLHDYIALNEGWYQGFLKFGDDWDVCMTQMVNVDGTRYRDWAAWDDPSLPVLGTGIMKEKWCPNGIQLQGGPGCMPYDYCNTKYMYVSGAYWVAKKAFMEIFPLNEDLIQCEGEDVEWSYRARQHWDYKMNPKSSVRLLRYKPTVFNYYTYDNRQ